MNCKNERIHACKQAVKQAVHIVRKNPSATEEEKINSFSVLGSSNAVWCGIWCLRIRLCGEMLIKELFDETIF